ncbi:MAG: hypothetical protein NXI21_19370 [Alphaproteobacteria bacterium]|nr:hypothetical protein [Alphaproteobacteria bacterium]
MKLLVTKAAALGAGLGLVAAVMYWAPVALCPRVSVEPLLFPCFPDSDRRDGVLYLLYCGATMQLFFMSGLARLQLGDAARIAGRLTALALPVAFFMHAPSFAVPGAFYAVKDANLWVFLSSGLPLLLWPVAFLRLQSWAWLWRVRSGPSPSVRQIRRAGLWFPWLALFLTQASASMDIHTYTMP